MSGWLGKLTFDTTDANTIADSANVGAYVRSDDGTLITHHTVGSDEGLDVYLLNSSIVVTATDLDIRDLAFATDKVDVSGSEVSLDAATLAALETITVEQGTSPWVIGDGGGSLTVDAVDLDIRNLVFATDKVDVSGSEVSLDAATLAALETITVEQGTSPWVIGDGGNSITVDAVDLDIRDLTAASDSVASWLYDGAGTALTSTLVGSDQALDVNVVGGVNVEVDLSHLDDSVRLGDGTSFFTSTTIGSDTGLDVNVINDPSQANTAIATAQNALAVAATAEDVVASPLANRKVLFVKNIGNRDVHVGASGVSASTGFPLSPHEALELFAGSAIDIEWVGPDTNQKVATLELS